MIKNIIKDFKLKKIKFINILKWSIILIVIIVLFYLFRELFGNVDSISNISKSAGIFGPIVLIFLIGLGILFSPFPSFVFIITAAYLYGMWWGVLYSYLGHLIAATSVFAIVKKFHITNSNNKYEKYKKLIRKNHNILYLLYMVPLIPILITSIISASSKLSWRDFFKIIFISFTPPVLFFSFFGNSLSKLTTLEIIIWCFILVALAIIVFKVIKNKSANKLIMKN